MGTEIRLGILGFLMLGWCAGALGGEGAVPTGDFASDEVKWVDFMLQNAAPEAGFVVQDAYKWLYQSACGGEHALKNLVSARQMFWKEWASVCDENEQNNEGLEAKSAIFESVRPDGSLGRLHLRVFGAYGGNPEMLWAAFVQSAEHFHADEAKFVRLWMILGEKLRENDVQNLKFSDWKALNEQLQPKGYPPVHHSEEYRAAWHPAYRLLSGAEARALQASCLEKAKE